jgi:hypothetical protein
MDRERFSRGKRTFDDFDGHYLRSRADDLH